MRKLASPTGLMIDSTSKLRAKEKSTHVMVWRFTAAPHSLRLLHRDSPAPEWLAFVPHAQIGSDLDESIIGSAESSCVFRYETPAGDVVYAGTSLTNNAGKHLGTAKVESAAWIRSHS